MPGIVVFKRRWSAGSDDLVVPGAFLVTIHFIWILILAIVLAAVHYETSTHCIELLWFYKIGYICVLSVSLFIELAICIVSLRGGILDTGPRISMQYWVYFKLVVILIEIAWLTLGIVWLKEFYFDCPIGEAKEVMFGLVICNWMVLIILIITIWCTFDAAGRSWVKMKKYQRSMRESESRFNYKRSNSMNRNWRQRKVIRAYQDSWDHRCRLLFCCIGSSDRNRNSFTDIARLLSDFFRDLDVVPSDVIAGLVLLRKFQKLERDAIVRQRKNGTYEFLSGAAITEKTHFLALNDTKDYDYFQTVIHYMHYAQSAYGWPIYLMTHSRTGLCQLCPELRCCISSCCRKHDNAEIIKDNCCYCNYAALKKMSPPGEIDVIYVTYHVDVGETPFYVAIDYTKRKVVISIRGTLSMKDILTDLNAEGECLPVEPPRDDWLGHKGMVQAAVYIKNKLAEEDLIQKALTYNSARNTQTFGLVLVGHSLGAGTAAILAILLKREYPSLQCFSYSPPGGLLSMPAVEYSKSFITSVVVGKDVVPRIGLHQMEALRADLINAIKRSVDPKWKTIACSVLCCGCGPEPTSVSEMSSKDDNINAYEEQRTSARNTSAHPNDSSIALTLHHPLYPPGRIIHIVRHHPTPDEQVLKKHEPVYQAIWAENTDFDEVLISPVMFKDHMPDKVLAALNKVITTYGPRKPQRQSSNANSSITSDIIDTFSLNMRPQSPTMSLSAINNNMSPSSPPQPHKICLETSFTSLQSPLEPAPPSSKGSSLAGSVFGRSQLSSILQYDVSSIMDDSGVARSVSGPSEATTVVIAEHQQSHQILKSSSADMPMIYKSRNVVAFDVNLQSTTDVISPCTVVPKSILHRQGQQSVPRKPVSLSFTEGRRTPSDVVKKLDLIHDDWFGLAPLASPESLSEISSISSRASLAISLANSIEKCLHGIISPGSQQQHQLHQDKSGEILLLNNEETELSTPRIMRRTPKIPGNLSTCADDWKSVDKYKRMGQIYITNPRVPSTTASGSSEEHSFESATSSFGTRINYCPSSGDNAISYESSKSADNIGDEEIGGNEILSVAKLTMSDSAILGDCECPQPVHHHYHHNLAKCVSITSHLPSLSTSNQQILPIKSQCLVSTTNSSSDTYYSAMSSLTGLESGQQPQTLLVHSTRQRLGVLESHFPVYPENPEETSLLLPHSPKLQAIHVVPPSPSTSIITTTGGTSPFNSGIGGGLLKKRNNADDRIFSKNESLPLLANLSEKSSPTNYVKRKKYIYPMMASQAKSSPPSAATTSHRHHQGESSV